MAKLWKRSDAKLQGLKRCYASQLPFQDSHPVTLRMCFLVEIYVTKYCAYGWPRVVSRLYKRRKVHG